MRSPSTGIAFFSPGYVPGRRGGSQILISKPLQMHQSGRVTPHGEPLRPRRTFAARERTRSGFGALVRPRTQAPAALHHHRHFTKNPSPPGRFGRYGNRIEYSSCGNSRRSDNPGPADKSAPKQTIFHYGPSCSAQSNSRATPGHSRPVMRQDPNTSPTNCLHGWMPTNTSFAHSTAQPAAEAHAATSPRPPNGCWTTSI